MHPSNTELDVIEGLRFAFPHILVKACLTDTIRTVWSMARLCDVPAPLLDSGRWAHLERLLVLVLASPSDLPSWYAALIDTPFYRRHAADLQRFLKKFYATYVAPADLERPQWNYYDVVVERPQASGPAQEFATAVGLSRFLRRHKLWHAAVTDVVGRN